LTGKKGVLSLALWAYDTATMSEFDLGAMMRQAQMLREQMETMQKHLDKEIVEGTAGGGMVKARATGTQQILSIELTPAAVQEDREMLQDLIVAAVNNALERSKALTQQKVGSLLPPGLLGPGGIPGL
jgi:nucleoid-associated protein EbfC